MKIEVNLRRRYFFTLLVAVLLIAGVAAVWATFGTAPNPGHLTNQLVAPAGCVAGQVLTVGPTGVGKDGEIICAAPSAGSGGSGGGTSSGGTNTWISVNRVLLDWMNGGTKDRRGTNNLNDNTAALTFAIDQNTLGGPALLVLNTNNIPECVGATDVRLKYSLNQGEFIEHFPKVFLGGGTFELGSSSQSFNDGFNSASSPPVTSVVQTWVNSQVTSVDLSFGAPFRVLGNSGNNAGTSFTDKTSQIHGWDSDGKFYLHLVPYGGSPSLKLTLVSCK